MLNILGLHIPLEFFSGFFLLEFCSVRNKIGNVFFLFVSVVVSMFSHQFAVFMHIMISYSLPKFEKVVYG